MLGVDELPTVFGVGSFYRLKRYQCVERSYVGLAEGGGGAGIRQM